MIIACPACATRYVVPDSAIGPEGRTVRCAKCKHSWFQDGPELIEPIAAAYAAPAATTGRDETEPPVRSATDQPTASSPANADPTPGRPAASVTHTVRPAETVQTAAAATAGRQFERETAAVDEPAAAAPVFDEAAGRHEWTSPGAAVASEPEEEISQFDRAVPFSPRRNWLRWLTWGAGAFAVLALAATVAMSTLGVSDWLPMDKPLFGADPGLTVEFPPSEQERRTLPNGAEFFGARVVVKNDARETKAVPPLLIVLRDARERVVYSWELVPPQRSLAPGEAMTINEAMTDVPKSAVYADIGWAPR